VRGLDPYGNEFWEKYELRQAFEQYLAECIECAKQFDFYDVFGHLGYVSKFCPHEDALMRYTDYKEAIEEVLRTLVEKGKGLEVNTSGIKNTGSAMPEAPILKRFFELGGEIVTVGSDAHEQSAVGRSADETLAILKSIGFKYVCAYDKRRPRFIEIP
jgi:histidinol-phosphatase (PHP family)